MPKRRWAAVCAVSALVTGFIGSAVEAAPKPLTNTGTIRLSGADRYSTAVAISKASFVAPQTAVFVASGEEFPDALAGGPAAAKRQAPLLLVRPGGVPSAVMNELKRLSPSRIYLLGGVGAVSESAARSLRTVAPTTRLSGADRFATAAATSKSFFAAGTSTAYVAKGLDFPDALAGGAAAAKQGAPMLLTQTASLPAATRTELSRLKPKTVVVLGGTGAVSSAVTSRIQSLLPTAKVVRRGGADRYATAASIVRGAWPAGSDSAFYATGANFPDSLAGTPAAAVNGAPLMLTGKSCMPAATYDTDRFLTPVRRVFLGGSAVVSSSTSKCVVKGSGTRTSPYSVGQTFKNGDWYLRFGTADTDAWPEVQAENMFNDPPASGNRFVMAPVWVKKAGNETGLPWLDIYFEFLGKSGRVYDDSCGVLPNDLDDVDDLYPGASATGNVCVEVPATEISGGRWRVKADFDDFMKDAPYVFVATR